LTFWLFLALAGREDSEWLLVENVQDVEPVEVHESVLHLVDAGVASILILKVLGTHDAFNHQGLGHVAFERLEAASIFICEGFSAWVKLRQKFLGQRLLEEFAANIRSDTVGVEELLQVDYANFEEMLDGSIENRRVIPYSLNMRLLVTDAGVLFEEFDVMLGTVMTMSIQSPGNRTHHVHVHFAEPVLPRIQRQLVRLEPPGTLAHHWEEIVDQGLGLTRKEIRLVFRRLTVPKLVQNPLKSVLDQLGIQTLEVEDVGAIEFVAGQNKVLDVFICL